LDDRDSVKPSAVKAGGGPSSTGRISRFVVRHPVGVAQGIFFVLVTIIVLQNLESTSIDLLFWSVETFPKLVLILVAMGIGAAAWEVVRRFLIR
jgi:uncharacterized integral membrane protein